jgi:mannose-6-phosphate isomerase-like protein (cupin superfamily)
MADYTAKRIGDMEAVFRGSFVRVRAELGVEAFGMQVIDMPPNLTQYPEHDHAESGQEEVFVVLRGGGEIEVDGERVAIDPETIVRVGPEARRKLLPGDDGMRVLALGGVPGGVYEAPDVTKLGEPDPMAAA